MPQIVTRTMNPVLDISTSVDQVIAPHKLRCREEKTQPGDGGMGLASAAAAVIDIDSN